MSVTELFHCCRVGDICRLEYLVEQKEVNLNIRDTWDSSPLYYACLCGHENVVKYLLQNGARCEANTFDGERCLYGALNNEIRNLLRSYKAVTTNIIRRDNYHEFLRRLLDRGIKTDINFIVHGECFSGHRCILFARSQYFAEYLKTKWVNKDTVTLTHPMITSWAFKSLIQYIYTGRLEAQFDQLEDIARLARHTSNLKLLEDIEMKIKEIVSFESTKPGVKITTIVIEPELESSDLQTDFGLLGDLSIPYDLWNEAATELPFPPEDVCVWSDVIFQVEGYQFHCHQLFFCQRSAYFKALVDDHFGETETTGVGDVVTITMHSINVEIFLQILYYIYRNTCELTPQNVFDVLVAADMYLLPGLKFQCASLMGQFLDMENIMNILHTSRLYGIPRLEDQCAEFVANNIEKMVTNKEFSAFVLDDANQVSQRQETDSIPFIDDVRFYITNFVQTYSDMYEVDKKIAIIDRFLEDLDLDA